MILVAESAMTHIEAVHAIDAADAKSKIRAMGFSEDPDNLCIERMELKRVGDERIASVCDEVTIGLLTHSALQIPVERKEDAVRYNTVILFENCELENNETTFSIAKLLGKDVNFQDREHDDCKDMSEEEYILHIKQHCKELQTMEPSSFLTDIVKHTMTQALRNNCGSITGKVEVHYILFYELQFVYLPTLQYLHT